MKVNVTCPICERTIVTNMGNRDGDVSWHIELAHPQEYLDAVEIAEQVLELQKELRDLTKVSNVYMFPRRGEK
jgi:hypothetical protein